MLKQKIRNFAKEDASKGYMYLDVQHQALHNYIQIGYPGLTKGNGNSSFFGR